MSDSLDSFFAVNDSEGTSYVLDLNPSSNNSVAVPAVSSSSSDSKAHSFISELLLRGLPQEYVSNFIKGLTIAYREMNADGMIGRPSFAESIEESLLKILNLTDDNIQPIWVEGVAQREIYTIVVKPGFRELFKEVRELVAAMALVA